MYVSVRIFVFVKKPGNEASKPEGVAAGGLNAMPRRIVRSGCASVSSGGIVIGV